MLEEVRKLGHFRRKLLKIFKTEDFYKLFSVHISYLLYFVVLLDSNSRRRFAQIVQAQEATQANRYVYFPSCCYFLPSNSLKHHKEFVFNDSLSLMHN